MKRAALFATVLLVCPAGAAHAQSLRAQCAGEGQAYCERIVDAMQSVRARAAIVAAGGNPVAGTASTLGMRLPGSPRVSITLRGNAARMRMPGIETDAATGGESATGFATSVDAAVGLFDGVNLAPTVGGFASLDVLASAGLLHTTGDELDAGSFTWAAGLRAGILRESFTAPGVSVSALYRRLPAIEYVLDGEAVDMQLFEVEGTGTWSLRGTVGKRVLGVGLTGGVGYDRMSGGAGVSFTTPVSGGAELRILSDDVTESRMSWFANASHTTTILNLVLELGWQQDGDRAANAHDSALRGGLFGGAAVRLAF